MSTRTKMFEVFPEQKLNALELLQHKDSNIAVHQELSNFSYSVVIELLNSLVSYNLPLEREYHEEALIELEFLQANKFINEMRRNDQFISSNMLEVSGRYYVVVTYVASLSYNRF